MIESKLAAPKVLPGPTGESNKLYLESRGIVVCLRDSDTTFDFWLMSIITALAAGNTVIALVDEKHMAQAQGCYKALQKTGIKPGIFQIARLSQTRLLLNNEHLGGVVIDSHSAMKKWTGEQLAAREGTILPLITAQSNQGLFYRLVTEKTITIDTTAAGGNASLMTMTPEDE
ncbi:MAG: trifunctional transcriptional regulator/proline dehydrogenase/L-glutamate gamma-semialdehyde dehydrogenase, partial [Psychrosphaera sp.]|nr:trifunctional transcriptional regulator/proline dehydrogenase/L-glutamate gamma-semialdehyde dehydrogenase [Psychrosphaera sp.]